MKVRLPFIFAALAAVGVLAWTADRTPGAATSGLEQPTAPVPTLEIPAGFRIAVWADVEGPRALALGPGGTVFVGSQRSGTVHALADRDGDGRAEVDHTIAKDLAGPASVAVLGKALYVGERSRIVRFDDVESHLDAPPAPEVVRDGMPSGGGHGLHYMAFGPDQRLYMGIGAPCNVCDPTRFVADGRELQTASITRMDADGKNWEVVATGVRNTVGIAFHPDTGEAWFTDNGRDNLGDDVPSCELNRLGKVGQDFGFPHCHQGDIADPEFTARSCSDSIPPVAKLGPHVAPLGMRFYTGKQFPEAYRNAAIVAEHGSWNRSKKIGYRVVAVHLDAAGGEPRQEVLVGGWLRDEKVSGRPVDVLQLPDGSVLISDDGANRIWRLAYVGA